MNRKPKMLMLVMFVLVGGLMTAACNRNINPAAPSDPPPDQSKYEPLGDAAPEHRVIDANGNLTKMWAKLTRVSPMRGSAVTLAGESNGLPSDSAHFSAGLTFGLDPLPNPATVASFTVYFSQDQEGAILGQLITGASIRGGGTTTVGDNLDRFSFFNSRPKYLVVKASYPGATNGLYGTFPAESGIASFLLDYK